MRLVAICCAQHMATYVALRTMLRMALEREGHPTSCVLNAPCGEGGDFRSLSRERNIFSVGLPSRLSRCGSTTSRSTRRTCTSRPARNSSNAHSIALGRRIAKPGRWHHEPRCLAVLESPQPAQTMLRRQARSPAAAPTFDRGQHISERNIGRQCDSSARAGVRSKAAVPSRGGHARIWAIASARRDREIVSSARLILVISKRVSDLSADPPDACSRAAGQLTRRDARLLQSPRSGTVAGGYTPSCGVLLKTGSEEPAAGFVPAGVVSRGSLVAAFVATQKTADHVGKLSAIRPEQQRRRP